ncbi:hypothetical protein C7459_11083 [Tumebacillus permanentifrigoris]|uniref:Uncharacterized protein n=1 Tax=Tumebacillus permanentifrigoris TaxID=378543 RepID=A0A316D751_9BACL|nr:hypothetical protein C7459_11083 [Tumebacillus permanentifrigoris]
MIHFFQDDEGYTAWCKENDGGFVFNWFRGSGAQGRMNKIHRADCRHLWNRSDQGRRTSTYAKVCSNSFTELTDFVADERGFSWSYCATCNPNYEENHVVVTDVGYWNLQKPFTPRIH